jgi:hypothetical protein
MLRKSSKKHWVWSICPNGAVYYRIDRSRGHGVIVELLQGFDGVLVADGYRACDTASRVLGTKMNVAICWAHARRKLIEAEQSYPEVTEAPALMGKRIVTSTALPRSAENLHIGRSTKLGG